MLIGEVRGMDVTLWISQKSPEKADMSRNGVQSPFHFRPWLNHICFRRNLPIGYMLNNSYTVCELIGL
jgi:hypothetical protein